jgi:hypothetical protein
MSGPGTLFLRIHGANGPNRSQPHLLPGSPILCAQSGGWIFASLNIRVLDVSENEHWRFLLPQPVMPRMMVPDCAGGRPSPDTRTATEEGKSIGGNLKAVRRHVDWPKLTTRESSCDTGTTQHSTKSARKLPVSKPGDRPHACTWPALRILATRLSRRWHARIFRLVNYG